MSKARVTIATGERPAASAKTNQLVTDYLVMGLPIINVADFWFMDNTTGPGPGMAAGWSDKVLGWYPYTADKSVHNQLRILFGYTLSQATFTNLEYTTDSGSTWSNALSGAIAPPVDLNLVNEFMNTFSLTSVTGSQWIGIRSSGFFDPSGPSYFNFLLTAFLYNSTDTPF
jgi:hypothetical protein